MPLTGTAVEQRLLALVRRAVEMRSDTELLALVRDDRVRRTHRPARADGVGRLSTHARPRRGRGPPDTADTADTMAVIHREVAALGCRRGRWPA